LSEAEIRRQYESGITARVVHLIAESPRTPKEIHQNIGIADATLSSMLADLEIVKALEYKDGKWTITKAGSEVLKKYF
jgi:DNA-binding IclR family transcriptional regulator